MKIPEQLTTSPHRRFNALTREWVLVSPHRTQRPWQGQVEEAPREQGAKYDPDCYLCPGTERAGGRRNPQYESTFVFENDFAALKPDVPDVIVDEDGIVKASTEKGLCRVLCFSPRHDLTVAQMSLDEMRRVVDLWTAQFRELAAVPWINHVEIFENRGAMMGASNPHPHCQLWANETVPNEPAKELQSQREYFLAKSRCLLCDYLEKERAAGERIIFENEGFVVLVPFWAVWPFETLVLSKRHVSDMGALEERERILLADTLRRTAATYDRVFSTVFPYSMGFHQRPTDNALHPEWHFHAHYYPPLLRSATVRKFMVGYELLGSPQRDITPESAAARLRELVVPEWSG